MPRASEPKRPTECKTGRVQSFGALTVTQFGRLTVTEKEKKVAQLTQCQIVESVEKKRKSHFEHFSIMAYVITNTARFNPDKLNYLPLTECNTKIREIIKI